jgi:hypothetical protein
MIYNICVQLYFNARNCCYVCVTCHFRSTGFKALALRLLEKQIFALTTIHMGQRAVTDLRKFAELTSAYGEAFRVCICCAVTR